MRLVLLTIIAASTVGCASTRPATPSAPPPEVLRLAAVLDSLGFARLPAGLAEGTEAWDDLPWTIREAVASADVRRHYLVRGDEVDVLIYPDARTAEGEGRRVREGIGALPLADVPEEAAAFGPSAYYVAGPVVVRHRGLDGRVRGLLTAALGEPVGTPSMSGVGIAYAPETPGLAYDPTAGTLNGAPLYQGEHVPSWSVDPAIGTHPQGGAYRSLYYDN